MQTSSEDYSFSSKTISSSDLVKKGYTVTIGWDRSSVLLKKQAHVLSTLTNMIVNPNNKLERSFLILDKTIRETANPNIFCADYRKENSISVIHRSQQFHEWFGSLDAIRDREVDARYLKYAFELSDSLNKSNKILCQMKLTFQLFRTLSTLYFQVRERGENMKNECERLLLEKHRLNNFADALSLKLLYFEELETVANSLTLPNFSDGAGFKSGEFLPFLHRLDLSLDFVKAHPHYTEGDSYVIKFQHVRSRAIASIRQLVISILDAASQTAISSTNSIDIFELNQLDGTRREASEVQSSDILFQNEMTLGHVPLESSLNLKFRAAAVELKDLMIELEKREKRAEYKLLIADCHLIYSEKRIKVLQHSVLIRFQEIVENSLGDVITLSRDSCTFLVELVKAELILFSHFFTVQNSQIALSGMIQTLGAQLFDVLRPHYILIGSILELSKIIDVLKGEIIEDMLTGAGESGSLITPCMSHVLADIQERLIFRTQTLIRDEVGNYMPTENDIDYPEKIVRAVKSEKSDLSTWYPPLEKTLKCLGHLYRCVEESTFSGLAQEAVSLCADNLNLASKIITRTNGCINGHLFLIKHLLILREQISPFNTDFCISVKELDFSHLGIHMKRVLQGELSLFSMTPENALMVLSSEGRPRVIQSTLNSKKELDKQLKLACEAFILFITKIIVGSMLSFITKATAVQVSKHIHEESLSNSAFASVDKLKEIAHEVNNSLDSRLPDIFELMLLYIPSAETRLILLNPIFSNVIEAHDQFMQLLDAEYDFSQVNSISIRSVDHLKAVFGKYFHNCNELFNHEERSLHNNFN